MNIFKMLIALIIFFGLLALAILNSAQSVSSINLYWKTINDVPLIFVIITSILIGIIIASIIGITEYIRLKLQVSALKKKLASLENELNSLRNLPISQWMEEEENKNIPSNTEKTPEE
jgi:putative membrane protein